MALDYASLLKNYGWDNLIKAIQSNPKWQAAYNNDRPTDNIAVDIPGIGPVTIDGNGRINALDMASEDAYRKTGNAPVYNTIWDGLNHETGLYNPDSAPSTYQVSHGGISPDTLGMLMATVVTAGAASGALGGAGAAEGAGAGLGGAGAAEGAGAGLGGLGGALGQAGDYGLAATAGSTGGGMSGILDTLGTNLGTFAAPSASDLAAFGADVNGLGITGGGIGSASSLVDAGIGGSAGYGSGALALGYGTDQLDNELNKLLQQQTLAQNGTDLLPTNLPTIDLNSTNPLDWLTNKLTNLGKNLTGGTTGAGGTGAGAGGGITINNGQQTNWLNPLAGAMALQYARNNSGFDTSALSGALSRAQGLDFSPLQSAIDRAKGLNTDLMRSVFDQSANIDTSALHGLQGASVDTSALKNILANSGLDLSSLKGILGQIGGNADAFVQSAVDPLQKNIAAGYGDLTQSLSQRGLGGSSFATGALGNYLSDTGRTLADASASARQQGLGLQGQIAGNIASLQNANTNTQADIAKGIAGIDLSNLGNQIDIAKILPQLQLSQLGLQGNLAGNIASQDAANAGLVGNLSSSLLGLQNQNLGLQGNLAGQLGQLNAAQAAQKNSLFGRAFDLIGRGLSGAGGSLSNALTSAAPTIAAPVGQALDAANIWKQLGSG